MLKSPDGNWIALQGTKVSHPSQLTRRKSLITVEREPAAPPAHEGLASDGDGGAEPNSSWTDALQEIHRAITDSTSSGWTASTGTSRGGSAGDAFGDSEGNWKARQPLLALLTRKMEETQSSPSSCNVDVNLNVEEEEREVAAEQEEEEDKSAASSLEVRSTQNPR